MARKIVLPARGGQEAYAGFVVAIVSAVILINLRHLDTGSWFMSCLAILLFFVCVPLGIAGAVMMVYGLIRMVGRLKPPY